MGRTQDSQFCFNYFYFCLHCVIPWRLLIYTISFKIPVYINLSSQNLHSAIAALKQEAKPLTTLNIEGLRQRKGGNAENKIRMLYTLKRQRQVNCRVQLKEKKWLMMEFGLQLTQTSFRASFGCFVFLLTNGKNPTCLLQQH